MHNLPAQISRYRVRSVLGIGGFGVVVAAFDEALDAHVAIKVLAREHAEDPALRDRFVREAQLLRRVRSPHVVSVHDIGELDDGRPYFVMELAAGGVLSDRIGGGERVDADDMRATIVALAGGLGALHAAGIIHRDVKPGNLLVIGAPEGDAASTSVRRGLLAAGERIVIGDLGLAKDQDRTAVGPTILGGTPYFRAPEQARRGADIGPAADVYAATAVVWSLLTGEPPASGADLEAQLATVPPAWHAFLTGGLVIEPDERFATMGEWQVAALTALDQAGGQSELGFRVAVPGATNPFKGLAPYQPEDAAFFCGREALVDQLVARLQSSRTLVVGGPSGSGKSSLVRAGLLPALGAGALPGSQQWTVLLFSPGPEGLDELAHQLGRLTADGAAPSAQDLHANARLARRRVSPDTRALLVIDQFEELFTHDTNATDREAFLAVLASLTAAQDAHVRVVLVLRADFYATCARFPWLAERISDNQILVGPMQRHELRRAIEGPASRAGLRLEAGLTDAVIGEAGDEPGALPLVAHALMETWLRRRGTLLTLDGFRAAGGVVGAIAQSAEQAYDRLDDDQRVEARRLLLRLVVPGENTPDTRRRLAWDEVRTDGTTRDVIDLLAAERLLTVDDRGVELVHETLIRTWPRLQGWIDESRDDLRALQRVSQAANVWETQGRDPDLLYRGAPLAAALEWRERADVGLADLPDAFLDAGRAARDAEERATLVADQRRRRTRRYAFGALSFLAIAAVASSLVAFLALRRSQDKAAEAEERFVHALATQADSLAETRPKLALLLAAESAARRAPATPEAQNAIVSARLALARSDIVPNGEPIPVGDVLTVLVTPDGSTIITGARDGTIRLWDASTGDAQATLTGLGSGVEEATVDASGRWLAAVGRGGLWRWDLTAKSTVGEMVARPSGALWSVAFSPDGTRLATAAQNGVVQVYDTRSRAPLGEPFIESVDILSVAFTVDGSRLVAGAGSGQVFVWDLAAHALVGRPIEAHGTNDVWEVAMNPDGDRFATASSDGTARVWSLESGARLATPFLGRDGRPTARAVSGIAWSADGASLYAGAADGRVHEWSFETQSEADASAVGHDDRVTDAATARDGRLLVTLGRDQVVRVWDLSRRQPVATTVADFGEPLYGVAVSPDGTRIAAGGRNGTVRVSSVKDRRAAVQLGGHSGRVFGVAFLGDGRLVTGDEAGTLRVFNVESGSEVARRAGAIDGAITSVAVSPDSKRVAASGSNGAVRVWTAADLEGPIAQTEPSGGINKVVFTQAGDLVTAGSDGTVHFWHGDGSQARPPLSVDANRDAVFSVAVSVDGRLLAAASATDGVTLWDVDSGRRGPSLNGQQTAPLDVVFTPDGDAFVSSNRQGVVTLWNAASGQAIGARFTYHTDAVWRVAVTPASVVVTASEDGRLATLDVLDLHRACELGAGALDARARARYLGERRPVGCPG